MQEPFQFRIRNRVQTNFLSHFNISYHSFRSVITIVQFTPQTNSGVRGRPVCFTRRTCGSTRAPSCRAASANTKKEVRNTKHTSTRAHPVVDELLGHIRRQRCKPHGLMRHRQSVVCLRSPGFGSASSEHTEIRTARQRKDERKKGSSRGERNTKRQTAESVPLPMVSAGDQFERRISTQMPATQTQA